MHSTLLATCLSIKQMLQNLQSSVPLTVALVIIMLPRYSTHFACRRYLYQLPCARLPSLLKSIFSVPRGKTSWLSPR
ncbi:hypothetical protein AZE42_11246 [Rhizopogon vesiculosus]|uniref:Uncharacterized protein n=1 Tax=Rhizopogon vesiculosus TaxID=180088 RepID=A0A1J8PUG2_9AGAM|nr:hypothetical protein AZE42_11246 [Rhizopogon vesiculosus]